MSRILPMARFVSDVLDGFGDPLRHGIRTEVLEPLQVWATWVVKIKKNRSTAVAWCADTCQGQWSSIGPAFFFAKECDALLFLLFDSRSADNQMARIIPMETYVSALLDARSGLSWESVGSGTKAVVGPIRDWATRVVEIEDVTLDPERKARYDARRTWCRDNCRGRWTNLGPVYFFFALERDAVLFLTFMTG
jgi:hypothetical protein